MFVFGFLPDWLLVGLVVMVSFGGAVHVDLLDFLFFGGFVDAKNAHFIGERILLLDFFLFDGFFILFLLTLSFLTEFNDFEVILIRFDFFLFLIPYLRDVIKI